MKGLKYPFRISNGAPEEASGEELVVSEVNQLFAQERGERIYDDDNGISLIKYIFENSDSLLRANVQREVTLSFNRNVERAELLAAPTKSIQREDGSVIVEAVILWRYRSRVYSLARSVEVER